MNYDEPETTEESESEQVMSLADLFQAQFVDRPRLPDVGQPGGTDPLAYEYIGIALCNGIAAALRLGHTDPRSTMGYYIHPPQPPAAEFVRLALLGDLGALIERFPDLLRAHGAVAWTKGRRSA